MRAIPARRRRRPRRDGRRLPAERRACGSGALFSQLSGERLFFGPELRAGHGGDPLLCRRPHGLHSGGYLAPGLRTRMDRDRLQRRSARIRAGLAQSGADERAALPGLPPDARPPRGRAHDELSLPRSRARDRRRGNDARQRSCAASGGEPHPHYTRLRRHSAVVVPAHAVGGARAAISARADDRARDGGGGRRARPQSRAAAARHARPRGDLVPGLRPGAE